MPPNRSSLAIVLLRWFDQYEEHVQLIQHAVSTYHVQPNTRATCSNASPSRMNPGSAKSMIGDISWMIGTYTYDPLSSQQSIPVESIGWRNLASTATFPPSKKPSGSATSDWVPQICASEPRDRSPRRCVVGCEGRVATGNTPATRATAKLTPRLCADMPRLIASLIGVNQPFFCASFDIFWSLKGIGLIGLLQTRATSVS